MMLNESWWISTDHAVSEAGRLGMNITLAPVWGPDTDRIFVDADRHAEFVGLVAKRYSNQAHIVWLPAGEYQKIRYVHNADGSVTKPPKGRMNADEMARFNAFTSLPSTALR